MSLKLQCSEVLHFLKFKPITMVTSPVGEMKELSPTHPTRAKINQDVIPKITAAKKIIFDSGTDTDSRVTDPIHDTAQNMMEAGLFHQPHTVMWIEDPFEDSENDERNFYLTEEGPKGITLRYFKYAVGTFMPFPKHGPRLFVFPQLMFIDFSDWNSSHKYLLEPVTRMDDNFNNYLSQAVYSFKKLIVTLNTANSQQEFVRAASEKKLWNGNVRTEPRDHTLVRIPVDPGRFHAGKDGRPGLPMRKQLVSGYNYGKNTRPIEKWKWIAPYWRGSNEVENTERRETESRETG